MSEEAVKTLTHAFIGSRLDRCNGPNGISEDLLNRLQSVQNAAARLVTGLGRREHISPVLRQLHWLAIRQRGVWVKCENAGAKIHCENPGKTRKCEKVGKAYVVAKVEENITEIVRLTVSGLFL